MKTWIKVLLIIQFLVIVSSIIMGMIYRERALQLQLESTTHRERAEKLAEEAIRLAVETERLTAETTQLATETLIHQKMAEKLQLELANCK